MSINKLSSRLQTVAIVAVFTGCATTLPLKADAPLPETEMGVADFSDIYNDRSTTQSVYPLGGATRLYQESMARVLVSPNALFEASRNSGDEPVTVNPAGATLPEPALANALGKPIEIRLSSLLLDYLAKKGSILVTPAILSSWRCLDAPKPCSTGSWLERTLAAPKGSDSDSSVPTVAFAVRELGIVLRKVPVVAERKKGDRISFRPRRNEEETSACGEVELWVPTVVFSGEIVSVQDGRLIARVHEEQVPEVDVAQHAAIDIVKWKAVRRAAYRKQRRTEPVRNTRYTYVKKWLRQPVYCKEALRSYRRVLSRVERSMRRQLPKTVSGLLSKGLDELYRPPGATPSWASEPK